MRTSLIQIATAALTVLILAACTDIAGDKELTAPPAHPDAVLIFPVNRAELVDVSAGAHHTCARTLGGTVFCWGENALGQIGVPSTATCGIYGYGLYPCVPLPARVTGSGTVNGVATTFSTATLIRSGAFHTCVISGGAAWCWGENWDGQVGNGTGGLYTNVTSPTPVSGGLTFTGLDAGSNATCGTTSGTLLFCWGQLRTGGPTSYTPSLASWTSGWSNNISLGDTHACAENNQAIWSCWGDNLKGEIGVDPVNWQYFDGPLGLSVFSGSSHVEAGSQYTCADQANGTVQCFGDNDWGQLGNSSFRGMYADSLQTVGGTASPRLHGVATGFHHACALDAQGAAWCWGANENGQLGSGQLGEISRDPVPVTGGLTFTKLTAGNTHTCGLATDKHIYCWGDNYFGQISPNLPVSPPPSGTPFPVLVL